MWRWERLRPNRYDAPMKPLPWDVEEMGSEGCRIYSLPLQRIQGRDSTVLYPVPKITAVAIVRTMNRSLEEREMTPTVNATAKCDDCGRPIEVENWTVGAWYQCAECHQAWPFVCTNFKTGERRYLATLGGQVHD